VQIASFLPFTSTTTIHVRCSDNIFDQIVEAAVDRIRIEDQSFVGTNPENETTALLQAYPNPSHGDVMLRYDLQGDQTGSITLLTLDGRVVSTYDLQNEKGTLIIDESLSSGMYFAVLKAGGNQLATQKLIRY
jgi:hypothetical protein